MSPKPAKYDKHVSPNWKPVAGLNERKPGMMFSDRIWHWLVSLGGLVMVVCGVPAVWWVPVDIDHVRIGIWIIAGGIITFALGFPTQAQRNGYRE